MGRLGVHEILDGQNLVVENVGLVDYIPGTPHTRKSEGYGQ